ncbi:hypothetical protein CJJ19_09450 [Candidatus Williamhamiltonella defendens]|nr:hypothetical protein [Candidatus Hamiltonella defensa]AYB49620.1 hypothetical protein CJJ19_09450 [Candidatus Hamiltonella defensa]
MDIANSTLSGTQNQFYGLWATGKETEVTAHQLKITSQGADSRLVNSYSANITLKDSTLSSIGQKARGYYRIGECYGDRPSSGHQCRGGKVLML